MRELALNVMDVAQNSISAKADLIRLTVEEDTAADRLTIRLEDNGCGMTPEQVKSVVDPFYNHEDHAKGRPGRPALQDGGGDDGRQLFRLVAEGGGNRAHGGVCAFPCRHDPARGHGPARCAF